MKLWQEDIMMSTVKNKKIFISIISHNHFSVIKKLDCVKKLNENFNLVIKSNIKDEELKIYCIENNITYLESSCPVGFGENNNSVYSYCSNVLGMKHSDYFIVMNPDLYITNQNVSELINLMSTMQISLSTINLFRDNDYEVPDNSVRNFPSLIDFFLVLFLKKIHQL